MTRPPFGVALSRCSGQFFTWPGTTAATQPTGARYMRGRREGTAMSPGCRLGRVQPGDCPGRGGISWSRPQTAPKHRRQGGFCIYGRTAVSSTRPQGDARRLGAPRQAVTRRQHGPSVAVRGKADGAHQPLDRLGRRPLYVRGHPQRRGPQRDKVTHDGTGETARIAEKSQLAGRFRRWWQVLCGRCWVRTKRRLSRRSYSTLLLPESYAAELRVCVPRCGSGCRRPLCVRAPWVPGAPQATDKDANATDGACGSGYADRLPVFLTLTRHSRMPARCRRLPRHRVRAGARVLRASVMRWSAASA